MADALVHPLTGEVIQTRDFKQLRAIESNTDAHLNREYRKLGVIRDARDALRVAIAELYPPARSSLPKRLQTPTQDRVERCGYCGRAA